MAITIPNADTYINANCIDIEDWTDSDEAKKQRILNVADRKLTTKYAQYTIPDTAVYEYANELATAFNDTNRLQQQGVASFGLTGVANFTFKDWAKSGLDAWISDTVLDLISEANGGVKLSRRETKWTVL
ncbi:hypothetical protein [Paenibacillus sp. PAMC21692]|uniref:hypothetical protein n=1 Tax=Paenibacillus sp. PAMC21692 TaxID=2762320 RepID=UPI00164D69FF|nr:hypothetical protein [Paenibacillus sp. PAMC21692]QNK54561.1 hypothetical protein H7F31_18040 [Paenibacillus sp. PAMC21692]